MELGIFIAIIIGVAIFCRFHDELPKAYRARVCMGKEWRRCFPNASKQDIRRFLSIFADAFAFRERNRLKFGPQDRLMDIYKGLYPNRWMPDQLEHVHLVQGLENEFKREFPEALMRDDLTLGMIFTAMTETTNKRIYHDVSATADGG